MKKIRARFTCQSIERVLDWRDRTKELHTVKLTAVTGKDSESNEFWEATPAGKVELTCITAAAAEFKLGEDYYVDFTPVKE